MTKPLPLFWFVLAALAIFANSLAYQPLISVSGLLVGLVGLSSTLNTALLCVTIGLIHVWIGRWAQTKTFWVFAWLHSTTMFTGIALESWLLLQRNRRIVGLSDSSPADDLLISALSVLSNLAGSIAFLVAIAIVVLTNRPQSGFKDHTFDERLQTGLVTSAAAEVRMRTRYTIVLKTPDPRRPALPASTR